MALKYILESLTKIIHFTENLHESIQHSHFHCCLDPLTPEVKGYCPQPVNTSKPVIGVNLMRKIGTAWATSSNKLSASTLNELDVLIRDAAEATRRVYQFAFCLL